jgi:hypothetical protein
MLDIGALTQVASFDVLESGFHSSFLKRQERWSSHEQGSRVCIDDSWIILCSRLGPNDHQVVVVEVSPLWALFLGNVVPLAIVESLFIDSNEVATSAQVAVASLNDPFSVSIASGVLPGVLQERSGQLDLRS